MGKTDTKSTVTLVLNGEQTKTSLRDVTSAVNATRAALARMSEADNPEMYAQRVRELQRLTESQRQHRTAIMGSTQAVQQQATAQKGFFESFKEGFAEMAGNVTAATLVYKGVSSILSGIKDIWNGSEQAYDEAQRTQTQLQAVLKSTGGVAGETKEKLLAYQDALMQQTGVDDDVIAKGEEMLLTFTNVRGKIYEDALPAIVDMTAALNGGRVSMEGVQSTSIMVGKALEDPIAGMTALKKVGVTLNDQQKEQIRTMVKSNDVMGAQAVIIKELNKEFGGTAKAIADTDVGVLQKYDTRIGNIQESIGQWIVKGKALKAAVLDPFLSFIEKAVSTPLPEKLREEQTELNTLVSAIAITNTNQEVRNRLIEDLQMKYPDFIGNISKEAATNEFLIKRLEQVNAQYRERIYMAVNEEKIKDIQERRNKAIHEEFEARQLVAKASGLSAEALARLNDQQIKELALTELVRQRKIASFGAGQGTGGGNSGGYDEEKAMKNVDLIINGRQRIATGFKEEADLMAANSVMQDKITKQRLIDIDFEEKAIRKRMLTEKDEAKGKDQIRLNQLESERKNILGIIEKPIGGPTAKDKASAENKAEALRKALADVQSEYLSLASVAQKGTVDTLDAQLAVMDDKFNKIVKKLQSLANTKGVSKIIRDKLLGEVESINGNGGLRETGKAGLTSAFTKKQDDSYLKDIEDQFKAGTGRIDNVYDQAQSDIGKQELGELNKVSNADPEMAEAERLNIKAAYAQKTFELEQKHLDDLKSLYQAYGKDTGALDKKIADNTIKENDRASKEKKDIDKQYIAAKKDIQGMEWATLQQGAQFLESILDERSGLYAAALIADKAAAIAGVVISTEEAIIKFKASVALLGPVGVGMAVSYAALAHIQEGVAIGTIAAQGIAQLSKGKKKAAKGALIPNGPSHGEGGIDLVNNNTGETIAEMEGGEPIMILSKDTYRNNNMLVNELLYNSQYRNGAPVRVNSAYATRPASSIMQKGGVVAAAAPTDSGASPAPANHANDRADRVDKQIMLLAEMLKQEAERPVVFSNRVFQRDQDRNVQIKNNADA